MSTQKWILLVEDDADDADLAMRALHNEVWTGEVVHASDGAEALDCLYRRGPFESRGEDPPSLVLLDLKMPRIDGFDVLQQIKSDTRFKSVPVVVFTSSRESTDVARSYQLGANAYIVKPVGFQQFSDTLQHAQRFWLGVNEPPPVEAGARSAEVSVAQAVLSLALRMA